MGIARGKLIIGQRYRHYKTAVEYVLITFAMNPNTEEIIVVYRDMRKDGVSYFRPLDEFCSKFSKVTNGTSKKGRRPTRVPSSPF